ncbi:5-formyltetrahydrofolate cyclo-ligase [Blastococcus atacamensis]|uniref:5-formyltetrahydrofolate cyclo-ligase n=1 Tax=Blastococcus atacamensis TaxID=2070508 RepID=UPI000CEC83C9|nr:5-formyltetrahydrofolate cyclo-ligase [Blastococcus atacamensis]
MTDPGNPALAKTALRERLLSRRRARPAAERAAAADAVAAALVGSLGGRGGTLAAFVPDPEEPGHGRLPEALRELGARLLLPVIPSSGRVLDWAEHTGELEVGRYGLSQPVGPRLGATALSSADTVVVPALAVDESGIRLGRGGGYYDRALAYARPDAVLVTVVFDDERLDELPREVHDRPVDAVVTPSGGWEQLARA